MFTSAGPRTLTATYAGDSNFNGSTSAGEPHTVNPADTTTTITSDNPDPSVVGQAVTVNFTVFANSPGTGTPTGNVTVSDGTVSCTGTVAAGTCGLTFTTPGPKTLIATYAGEANFNTSTSAGEPHTVNPSDSATAITLHDPDPSVVGQSVPVVFQVTAMSPGSGTPTGNVTVEDLDTLQTCTATVGDGQCSLTFTVAGTHHLEATYAGDANFNGSTSATEPHTVNPADTTTTITSDNPDPSVVGQSVTINYSVTVNGPGAGVPTGNVNVSDGTQSCTGTVAASTCSITFTSAGPRTLTATYVGDANFNGSASAGASHQVKMADTTTTITSDNPDPSVVGQSVSVHYAVAVTSPGAGTPTGNVTVSDGTLSCTGTVGAGMCSITFTSAGAKSLTATYAGDSNFNGSASTPATPHTVIPADTTTSIASDNPDPSMVGQSVTVVYSVTVNGPGAGTPTGNVTVSGGPGVTCTATVAAGQCNVTFTSTGAKTLTATYAGDANFNGSTSAGEPHTVNAAGTTTAITSDAPDPSVVGQSVIVQYSVTPSSPGTPTGNVTVSDGTVSCTGTVATGQCTITFTSAGAKTLTATYAGDSNYTGSTSANESHQVNKANTTTSVTGDPNDPTVVGESYPVSYSVTVNSPGAGSPTGTVTVTDGVSSCTGAAPSGSCSLTSTSAGGKTLTASYGGDAKFNSSLSTDASAGEPHTVNKADTSTAITSHNPNPSTTGQSVTVAWSVGVTSPGSAALSGNVTVTDGTISCTAAVTAGSCSLTFTTTGTHNLTATYAGNTNLNGSASGSAAHNVTSSGYTWSGFFQPVDNLPTLNSVQAGQAIPVKFSLGGNQGLNIFQAGSPYSQQISCSTGVPVSTIDQTVNAGGSSLSYDASSGQYNYIWKTDKAWKGTCRQFTFVLTDNSMHQANFQFK
jgi:hypothetical protein